MQAVDTILNATFAPVAAYGGADPRHQLMFVIFAAAALVSIISTSIYKIFVDHNEIKELKKKLEKYRAKLEKAKAKNNPEDMQKIFQEVMQIQSDMMSKTMKPTLYSFFPIIFIFGWLRMYTAGYHLPYVVRIPFPFFYSELGWLGWYILSSMAISIPLRKFMGLDD